MFTHRTFDPTVIARFSHQNLQLFKYKISEGESMVIYCIQTRSEDMAATSHMCYVTSTQQVTVYALRLSRILPPLPVRLQKLKDVAWWHSPTSKVRLSILWCCFCPGVGSCWRPVLLLHFFWMDWPTTSGFHPELTSFQTSHLGIILIHSSSVPRDFSLNSTDFNDRNISEKWVKTWQNKKIKKSPGQPVSICYWFCLCTACVYNQCS